MMGNKTKASQRTFYFILFSQHGIINHYSNCFSECKTREITIKKFVGETQLHERVHTVPKAITTTEHEGLSDAHISSVCIESVYLQ